MTAFDALGRAYEAADLESRSDLLDVFRAAGAALGELRELSERCAACGAHLFGIFRSHHHTEDGQDVTRDTRPANEPPPDGRADSQCLDCARFFVAAEATGTSHAGSPADDNTGRCPDCGSDQIGQIDPQVMRDYAEEVAAEAREHDFAGAFCSKCGADEASSFGAGPCDG